MNVKIQTIKLKEFKRLIISNYYPSSAYKLTGI